ncbi:unnamed protein product [Candidula unifasciata]|uniref:Pyruvate kinase n=1 Tax=Candidula unifasciata TaxID=100452 RepID=A0A8S3ZBI5_9EUPU|nr:unnamed protein product [Candidula unifasciata]
MISVDIKRNFRQGLNLTQSHLQQICELNVDSKHPTYRMTNIICTIGPACDSTAILCELIEKGMNICRFNLAHVDHSYHLSALHNLRDAISKSKHKVHSQVATAVDICGPAVRIGKFRKDITQPFFLKKGEKCILTSDESYAPSCEREIIYASKSFINKAEINSHIYIEDGPLCLMIQEKDGTSLRCLVTQEGEINSYSHCHVPRTLPSDSVELTDKDKEDIDFCIQHKMDMVFVSWVWCPEIIIKIREHLGEAASNVKIIAKIENYEGVKRIDEILAVADGILVGRGDLGIDVPPEKVVLAQKMIIGRANMAGKPVICAAQMLDSMVNNPRPTRAEASDVANAILDGADCVMLSKETAIGKFPVKAVETLASICKEAENALYHARLFQDLQSVTPIPTDSAHSASIAAVEAAFRCRASAIVVVTNSGRSATMIARYRPHCVIIAVTRSHHTAQYLNLYRGIFAVLYTDTTSVEWYADVDTRIDHALNIAKGQGYVKAKDIVILVTGYQTGPGCTNTVRSIVVPCGNEKTHFLNIQSTTDHLGV